MERLTKLKNGRITYNEKRDPVFECGEFCDNCPTGTAYCRTMKKMIRKLATYEDLEEQGLLVRLPADKNAEIYLISSRWTVCSECGSRFDEYSCSGCEYECDSKKEYYVYPTYLSSINADTYANQFGKTVFLTREEAEKKLEGMKNGKK